MFMRAVPVSSSVFPLSVLQEIRHILGRLEECAASYGYRTTLLQTSVFYCHAIRIPKYNIPLNQTDLSFLLLLSSDKLSKTTINKESIGLSY